MTDLVPYQPGATTGNQWIDLVQPAADLAQRIAGTEFVPDSMRNKPAAIVACLLYGAELGIGPMMALSKVDIVKGRPAPRAELARALALAAGHEIWVEESTNTRVTVSGRRKGSDHVQTVTWTADDVRRAGISSPMYQKYGRQMLLARASAELVRQMCPDVLGGIGLFAEEAEAEASDVPAVEPVKATATTRKRSAAPAAAPAAIEAASVGQTPDDAAPAGPTEPQIKRMMASFNEIGIREKADRLAFIAAAVRPVESSKDLSVDEAARVIDALDGVIAGRVTLAMLGDVMTLTPVDADGTDDLPPLPFEEDGQ